MTMYYFVPAVQISFLSRQPQEQIGSRDLCYHNFRCSIPFYIFSDFNSGVRNMSYFLFGLAFIFLVWQKQRRLLGPDEGRNKGRSTSANSGTGIPQQLGIFYAMGCALMAQTLFSVCYHTC